MGSINCDAIYPKGETSTTVRCLSANSRIESFSASIFLCHLSTSCSQCLRCDTFLDISLLRFALIPNPWICQLQTALWLFILKRIGVGGILLRHQIAWAYQQLRTIPFGIYQIRIANDVFCRGCMLYFVNSQKLV